MKSHRPLSDLVVVKGADQDWYFAFPPKDKEDNDLVKAIKMQMPMEFEEVRIFYNHLLPVPDSSGSLVGFREQSGLRCLPLYDGPVPKLGIIPKLFYKPEGVRALKMAKELIERAEKNEAANRSGLALPR